MDYEYIMSKNNIKKTCKNCEFNFRGTCAGGFYGEKIKDLKVKNCDAWGISLDAYSLCIELARKYYKSKDTL